MCHVQVRITDEKKNEERVDAFNADLMNDKMFVLQSLGKIHPGFTNTQFPYFPINIIVLDNEIVITKR